MVLTNMLPSQGNGTYVFHVWAQDREGHAVLLGTRTMTCANAQRDAAVRRDRHAGAGRHRVRAARTSTSAGR